MITIKGRFVTYGEIWFDEETPVPPAVDILMFRLRPAPVDHGACSPFITLVSDLSMDGAAIMASLGSSSRYEVRRAESKDNLLSEFLPAPQSDLADFCEFYDAFAKQKSLQPAYRRGLAAACDAGNLVLSAATRGSERIVWHAYIKSGQNAALLHSASHFRSTASVDRAALGRANRWLHWRDMLAFKQIGVVSYDWGGMFEDESVPEQASINKFKREFGGREQRLYNCTIPDTLKGRAYLACQRILDRAT